MKNIFLKIAVITTIVLTIGSFQKNNKSENLVKEKSVVQELPILDELPLASTNISIDDVVGNYIGVLRNVRRLIVKLRFSMKNS